MMLNDIFAALPPLYRNGGVSHRTTFYFSIDDVKKTVILDADSCSVIDGKAGENADCVCKTSEEFFLKVWNDGYKPGMKDFLGGAIKSNAPHLLQEFLKAFGK
jgi:putative sterol carrier protein